MKLIKQLIGLCLLISSQTNATVMTVNNNGAGQYSDLNSAYIAATSGDTLLVSGSALEYSIATSWTKNIIVIGPGFNASKQVFKEVKFGPNTFTIASGSRFLGIRFSNNVNATANISALYFESCRFDGDVWPNNFTLTNVTFLNCLFSNPNSNLKFDQSNVSSILASHCIFLGFITGSNNVHAFNLTLDHCVFLRNTIYFVNVYNAVISNSIFYGNAALTDIFNSSFNNNLSRLTVANNWSLNGNISSHDTDAVDPLFLNVPTSGLYNTGWDFHLQNGSPAKGRDSNGSDIGLHDASSTFNEAGEPQNIPVIRQMLLQSVNVAQSDSVTVKVRSTKPR